MNTPTPEDPKPQVPAPAIVLGTAGLIPFLFLTGLWLTGTDTTATVARQALLAYSIAILSFMGAVHWGLAMTAELGEQPWRRYFVSVLPALAATATAFMAGGLQFLWLAACLFGLLLYDLYAVKQGEAPDWYPRLRWPLTVAACVCLLAAALR
ncbi:MAG: DUF3429 domain-containing protein [Pseudomonadota bacterium]